mmetsp:Transcript_33965/g.102601  ORF Transcript_33965/g.102601 Transcript_33965/m.102601 type:complete len:237 (-) Transcript_33965:1234-1944(-)
MLGAKAKASSSDTTQSSRANNAWRVEPQPSWLGRPAGHEEEDDEFSVGCAEFTPSSMCAASAAMASKLRKGKGPASISAAAAPEAPTLGPPASAPWLMTPPTALTIGFGPAVVPMIEAESLALLLVSRSRGSTILSDASWGIGDTGLFSTAEAVLLLVGVCSTLLSFHAARVRFGLPNAPCAPLPSLFRLKSFGMLGSRLTRLLRDAMPLAGTTRFKSSCKPSNKKAKNSCESCCS